MAKNQMAACGVSGSCFLSQEIAMYPSQALSARELAVQAELTDTRNWIDNLSAAAALLTAAAQ
jgi:hypothetical protein